LLFWNENDANDLNFKIRTPWDFRILFKFNLLAQGRLLVKENYNSDSKGLECSITKHILRYIDSNSGMKLHGRKRPRTLTGDSVNEGYEYVYHYRLPDRLKTAKSICKYIDSNWDKQSTIATKDGRRIFHWLNLYCEQERNKGTFSLSSNYKPKSSYQKDFALMEDAGWIEREATDEKGGVAVYHILKKDINDEQEQAFYGNMDALREEREQAWEKVLKMLQQEDVWKYLKKNL
jgi:hypothetical protein